MQSPAPLSQSRESTQRELADSQAAAFCKSIAIEERGRRSWQSSGHAQQLSAPARDTGIAARHIPMEGRCSMQLLVLREARQVVYQLAVENETACFVHHKDGLQNHRQHFAAQHHAPDYCFSVRYRSNTPSFDKVAAALKRFRDERDPPRLTSTLPETGIRAKVKLQSRLSASG